MYILANKFRTLYIGVTNDLHARVYQHKRRLVPGFTSKYGVDRLVYFEQTPSVDAAIAREKQLKGWLRAKKVALIEAENPQWQDLAAAWFEAADADPSQAQDDRATSRRGRPAE